MLWGYVRTLKKFLYFLKKKLNISKDLIFLANLSNLPALPQAMVALKLPEVSYSMLGKK